MADLNTQFPAWLAQQSWLLREDRKNVGNEFLQGAQIGANISYQNRALQLQRDAFNLKRDTQLQQTEGMVQLGKTLSDIATNGEWADPSGEAKFWATVTRYPGVTQSPQFDNLVQIFENAKKAKAQHTEALLRLKEGYAPGTAEKNIEYGLRKGYINEEQAKVLYPEQLIGPTEVYETTIDQAGNPVTRIIKGRQGLGKDLTAPTTAFQTQLQQQLHAYDNSMALLNHIEQNINASDFGLRGMAKELQSRIGGQFGLGVSPEQLDVRNSLKQLRQDLYKALRSDSNISEKEVEKIQRMLPEVEMFDVAESLPNAVGKLLTVKRTLTEKSRAAAQRLGVSPPLWTMNPGEIKAKFGDMSANAIKAQVQAGKLSQDDAVQIIQQLNIPLYSLPADQGPAPMIETP